MMMVDDIIPPHFLVLILGIGLPNRPNIPDDFDLCLLMFMSIDVMPAGLSFLFFSLSLTLMIENGYEADIVEDVDNRSGFVDECCQWRL
jgi:hypothetical protein